MKRIEESVPAVAERLRRTYGRLEEMGRAQERLLQETADVTSGLMELCRARLAFQKPESPEVQELGKILQAVRRARAGLQNPFFRRLLSETQEQVELALASCEKFAGLGKKALPRAKPRASPRRSPASR